MGVTQAGPFTRLTAAPRLGFTNAQLASPAPQPAAPPPQPNRVGANISALFGGQLATWSLTLLWTLVVPRALGPAGVALLVMAWSASSLLSILGGLSSKTLLVKEMAAHPEDGARLLGAAMAIRAASVIPCLGLTLVYIRVGHFHGEQALVLSMAALIAIAILFLEPYQAGFQAIERMNYLAYGEVLNKGVVTAAGIALVLLGFSGVSLVASMVLAAGVVVALSAFWSRSHFQIAWRPDLAAIRSLLVDSLSYWAFAFFFTFYLWVDSTMLILMTPAKVVGWYGVPTRLFTTLLFVPMIIATAWLPRLAAAFTGSPDRLKTAARTPIELTLTIMLPVSAGAALVAYPLIHLLYGTAFDPAAPVFAILAITLLPMSLNMIAYNVLVASNRQAIWTAALAGACILNPVLNFLLIRATQDGVHNGAIGAALSLLLTELAIAILAGLIVRKFLDAGLLSRTLRTAAATLAMAAVVIGLSRFGLALEVPAGAASFAIMALLLRVTSVRELREAVRLIRPGR
jgi:O-antigen/teichoic acid export membrane protein